MRLGLLVKNTQIALRENFGFKIAFGWTISARASLIMLISGIICCVPWLIQVLFFESDPVGVFPVISGILMLGIVPAVWGLSGLLAIAREVPLLMAAKPKKRVK